MLRNLANAEEVGQVCTQDIGDSLTFILIP